MSTIAKEIKDIDREIVVFFDHHFSTKNLADVIISDQLNDYHFPWFAKSAIQKLKWFCMVREEQRDGLLARFHNYNYCQKCGNWLHKDVMQRLPESDNSKLYSVCFLIDMLLKSKTLKYDSYLLAAYILFHRLSGEMDICGGCHLY